MKDIFNLHSENQSHNCPSDSVESFDNKIIKFPESSREDYCSHEEVGFWVDRLLQMPDEDVFKSLPDVMPSDLAEVLIENELV